MKIVSAKEMTRIEELALKAGENREAWVRKAGEGIARAAGNWAAMHGLEKEVSILAGGGHNGADAFAAGLCLLKEGFKAVAYWTSSERDAKALCRKMAKEFERQGGLIVQLEKKKSCDFDGEFVLDGIFGTGFSGQTTGLAKMAIERANQSGLPILSIDIASGIDGSTGEAGGAAIKAALTIALGFPKTGCFLQDGWNHAGQLEVVDFGLPAKWSRAAREDALIAEPDLLANLLPKIVRNRHKYQAGCVLGYAGSSRYSGAAKLASLAALRGGAGIVKLFYPEGAEREMASMPYEIIHGPWDRDSWARDVIKANAVFLGPGLGQGEATEEWLKRELKEIRCPIVFDADALTGKIRIPKGSICTPHRKEMLRLLNKKALSEEALLKGCQMFCDRTSAIVVLKGAPTWIFRPKKPPYLIALGDPGMATAGSGDVLTGLIAALLAQGCNGEDAALLGASIHALAGEAAAFEQTSYCMIAGDLIACFAQAFRRIADAIGQNG